MSKYARAATTFTDGGLLMEALDSLGIPATQHDKPAHLRGWLDQTRKAEIVIPREALAGAHADIGFTMAKDGTYTLLADEDDMRTYGYGKSWLDTVKVAYREKQTMQTAQRLGLQFLRSTATEDGGFELEFRPMGRR